MTHENNNIKILITNIFKILIIEFKINTRLNMMLNNNCHLRISTEDLVLRFDS